MLKLFNWQKRKTCSRYFLKRGSKVFLEKRQHLFHVENLKKKPFLGQQGKHSFLRLVYSKSSSTTKPFLLSIPFCKLGFHPWLIISRHWIIQSESSLECRDTLYQKSHNQPPALPKSEMADPQHRHQFLWISHGSSSSARSYIHNLPPNFEGKPPSSAAPIYDIQVSITGLVNPYHQRFHILAQDRYTCTSLELPSLSELI